MPVYAYECNKCHYQFECEQKMTDKPRQRCPKCRSKVRKLINWTGNFVLHGSGWPGKEHKRERQTVKRQRGV